MEMKFKNIYKVELTNGTAPVVPLRQIYYGDKLANRVGAYVLMDGTPANISGTCVGTAIRADGSTVPLIGTVSGSQAYVDLPPACYAIPGEIQVYVKLASGETETTVLAAVGTVRITETGTVIDPGIVIPSVSDLTIAIEDAVQLMAASAVHITKTGSSSVTVPDAAGGVGMDVSVTIPVAQEAGTPSLNNVLPFALRTGVTFSVVGADDSSSVDVDLPAGAAPFTGGVLRVDPTGKARLSRTWEYYEFDGTEAWTLVNGSGGNPKLLRCQYDKNNDRFPQVTSASLTRCTALPYAAILTTNDSAGIYVYKSGSNTYPYIHVRLDDMSGVTADSWKETLATLYAAGTPLAINYRRATPAVQEWDAEAVLAFTGENTVSSTPGNTSISITYTADTKEYADRIAANIAPSEQRTAQSAHAVGELFMIDNVLYQATDAIAQGDTLTVDVNIQQTTIAAVIAAL